MNGYVINKQPIWTHAMKRSVGPGAKISLDELYEQYGVKYDLKEGKEFVNWLRTIKLKDAEIWGIVFNDDNNPEEIIKDEQVAVKKEEKKESPDVQTPFVKAETSVADIVNLSVRKAREILPKIDDLKLLKYALQEANQLAGKDSLCRVIRKRVDELQLAR